MICHEYQIFFKITRIEIGWILQLLQLKYLISSMGESRRNLDIESSYE